MIKLLIVLGVGLVGLAAFVRLIEARLAFFPASGERPTPAEIGMPYSTATIQTSDGERLRMWVLPAPTPRAFVVYFHGNGGNLSVWLPILAGIRRQNFAVAAVDYRGYGGSTGRPSERGLYRDVDAVLAWLRDNIPPGVAVVFWGRSLGTTMAAYATTKRRADRLILEAGFSRRAIARSGVAAAHGSVVVFVVSVPDRGVRQARRLSNPGPPRRRRSRHPHFEWPRAVRCAARAETIRHHFARRSQ